MQNGTFRDCVATKVTAESAPRAYHLRGLRRGHVRRCDEGGAWVMAGIDARMKAYEFAARHVLTPRTYTIIRIDGKTFHSFTRHCQKPFDFSLMDAMESTAQALVAEIHGAVLAYHQSDEISIVLQDFAKHGSDAWMGGVVQKQASVAASVATAQFNAAYEHPDGVQALFDARTFTIPAKHEVINYLIWRQLDATRNAVNMAASAHFAHERVHRLTSNQRQELLFSEAGVNFNDYPTRAKRGTVIRRETFVGPISYVRKDTGDLVTEDNVEQSQWVADREAPVFTRDRAWLARLIPDNA